MKRKLIVVMILSSLLQACGVAPPSINEAWEPAEIDDSMIKRIKAHVFCELRTSILEYGTQTAIIRGKYVPVIPEDWGARTTLTLTIDESSALNPGVTLNQYFRNGTVLFPGQDPITVARTANVGIGGTLSSQATRIDRYYSYYDVKKLKLPRLPAETTCTERRDGSSLLLGDLGIRRWLKNALELQETIPSSLAPKTEVIKTDVLSYTIKFIVITSGNVNPVWKLVSLSANSGANPLFSTNRTRTHELLLTLGPSKSAAELHLVGEIGQAVANSVRTNPAP